MKKNNYILAIGVVAVVTAVAMVGGVVFADNGGTDGQNQASVGIKSSDSNSNSSDSNSNTSVSVSDNTAINDTASSTDNSSVSSDTSGSESESNIEANNEPTTEPKDAGSANSSHSQENGLLASSSSEGIGNSSNANASANGVQGLIQAAIAQATNRVQFLQQLSARLGDTKFLSDSEKTALQNEIQNQIADLNNFQNSAVTATSSVSLQEDRQSVVKSTKTYNRIIPQTALLSAMDRIQNIATMMTTVSAKLQVRLSANASTSPALETTLTALNAKIADAQNQATTAKTNVSAITSTETKAQVLAVFTRARADLRVGQADLVAARKDIISIVQGLGVSVSENTSVTASTTATTTTN